MYELPPILRGTEQEQLQVLRDYLVRTVQNIEKRMDERDDEAGQRLAEKMESVSKDAGAAQQRMERLEKRVSVLEQRLQALENG